MSDFAFPADSRLPVAETHTRMKNSESEFGEKLTAWGPGVTEIKEETQTLSRGIESKPLKKEHRHDTKPCSKCGLHPLLYRAGLWLDGIGWTTGRMWYECPGCGKRGGKTESHEQAALLWKQRNDK